METTRIEIASRVLAGFAANPAVFAKNGMSGWSLVNCTDEDIVGYALNLADKLIDGEAITRARANLTAAIFASKKSEQPLTEP